MLELTVKLRSEDGSRKYSKCFITYEAFIMNSEDDEYVQECISETMKEWGNEPADVVVSTKKVMV